MPFVPELVSTTKFSNRSSAASASKATSQSMAGDSAGSNARPRFLPEQIETTRRSNRGTPNLLEASASQPSSSSSTPKASLLNAANANVVPSPASALSSASKSGEAQVNKPRFLPEPVEISRRSNRTDAGKISSNLNGNNNNKNNHRKGWGRDSDDEGSEAEELEAYHSLRKEKQRRIPPPIVAACPTSVWFPESDIPTRWPQPHCHVYSPNQKVSSPSQEKQQVAAFGSSPHGRENADRAIDPKTLNSSGRQEISSKAGGFNNSNNGAPGRLHGAEMEGVLGTVPSNRANSPGIERPEDDGSDSLSSSPSSLKSDTSGSNYLLSSSSSSTQYQQRSVVPSITNSEYFSEEPGRISSYRSGANQPQGGLKRPISPGTIVARDFAYNSGLLHFPKGDASQCRIGTADKQGLQRSGGLQHNIPTNIIQSSPTVSSPVPNVDNNSKPKSSNVLANAPTAADLRDQVLVAQSQILRDNKASVLAPTSLHLPSGTPKLQQPQHLPQTGGSDEPKRKKPLLPFSFIPAAPRPMNLPLSAGGPIPSANGLLSPAFPKSPFLCESPMPTTLFYESSKNSGSSDYFSSKKKQPSGMSISSTSSALSRDTALTTPSTRPSSPNLKYGYPTTSTSSLVKMVCDAPPVEQTLVADPPNMCPTTRQEVSTEFVVAVFNYLSLGHESIARKFDKEISAATGWSLERVVTDRLGALREYVEEYVDTRPKFGSGMGW